MIIGKTDLLLTKLLNTNYQKQKEISSNIANLIEKSQKQDINVNENKTLETYMAELIKNSSKYNAATRLISIRSKIYETSIKGR
ncbi:MAG: hypothetical protein N2446_01925 [Elusimicrobiales bacterium]|nr:hypothetical protein [Elusimicrobiales bacterium]